MWIVIISSIVYIALATILFTPPLRKVSFYRALSIYFLFKGLWAILSFVISSFGGSELFILVVDNIGTIILMLYLLISIYIFYKKNK